MILTACPPGFFGLDCINRCDSYCSGNESCDPALGICTEGCKGGWSGLMCGLGILTKTSTLIMLIYSCNNERKTLSSLIKIFIQSFSPAYLKKNDNNKESCQLICTLRFRQVKSTVVWWQHAYCHWCCCFSCNCFRWKYNTCYIVEKENRDNTSNSFR